jgi:hypothetical protein
LVVPKVDLSVAPLVENSAVNSVALSVDSKAVWLAVNSVLNLVASTVAQSAVSTVDLMVVNSAVNLVVHSVYR